MIGKARQQGNNAVVVKARSSAVRTAATATGLLRELQARRDPDRARMPQRFFKTGPGQYGEGDQFLGLTVPMLRSVARQHLGLELVEAGKLLQSGWHEARLLALLIMVGQYQRAEAAQQLAIYRLYMRSTAYINNWDLVDASASHIVGAHLQQRDRTPLLRFARSGNVWRRRIAILATFHYIKQGEFAETLRLAELLLQDEHDLIHKAVGWMLREVGKRDQAVEEGFLKTHAARMPRTMLRYAVERFAPAVRQHYLQR